MRLRSQFKELVQRTTVCSSSNSTSSGSASTSEELLAVVGEGHLDESGPGAGEEAAEDDATI